MVQWIVFIIGSGFLVYVSRASLRSPKSHGFPRLFAWEFILGLFLLNVTTWFDNPLGWHQLISWVLLIGCVVPLVLGTHALTSKGRPADHREGDDTLLSFEHTTTLVTTGVYRHIRHPLYSSLLFLAWGIFFKDPSWIGGLLAVAANAALYATARADEAECLAFFGEPYADYMKASRRFVPYLF
jgi:protein-S-isoprenylcysteine O-methyltransferase Ste14